MTTENKFIKWFDKISLLDLPLVGGKNASLGEMVSNMSQFGINVPFGFAITTEAYDKFISDNNLENYSNSLAGKHGNARRCSLL